ELANYPNVAIPTNIRVVDQVRNDFAGFYEALFQRTINQYANAVVTEYAWDAQSCDPCPLPPLTPDELATLGADVLPPPAGATSSATAGGTTYPTSSLGMTLTRLHYRYTSNSLGEDLVFRAGPPIEGGRG